MENLQNTTSATSAMALTQLSSSDRSPENDSPSVEYLIGQIKDNTKALYPSIRRPLVITAVYKNQSSNRKVWRAGVGYIKDGQSHVQPQVISQAESRGDSLLALLEEIEILLAQEGMLRRSEERESVKVGEEGYVLVV